VSAIDWPRMPAVVGRTIADQIVADIASGACRHTPFASIPKAGTARLNQAHQVPRSTDEAPA
jgi:hypothetical protein